MLICPIKALFPALKSSTTVSLTEFYQKDNLEENEIDCIHYCYGYHHQVLWIRNYFIALNVMCESDHFPLFCRDKLKTFDAFEKKLI